VDRCALFVDASYMLADGAMAVHGTRRRDSVSWDYSGLLKLLSGLSRDRSGLPVLRCYWYEATVEGRRTAEHDTLADIPGLKLRLGRMRPGRREGVEAEVRRDLISLARNAAISDAVIVSAEEDLAEVVAEVQDLGIRVILVHITADGSWTVSRALRQECDDILEIGGVHLRPFVDLIPGAEPSGRDEKYPAEAYSSRSLANGHGPAAGAVTRHGLPAAALPAAPIYNAPVATEYQPAAQPVPAAVQQGGNPQGQQGGRQQGQPGDLPAQSVDLLGQSARPERASSQRSFGPNPLGDPAGLDRREQAPQRAEGQPSQLPGAQSYPPSDQFLDRLPSSVTGGSPSPGQVQLGGSQRHGLGSMAQQYPQPAGSSYGGSAGQLPDSQFPGPQHGQHGQHGSAASSSLGAPQAGPYSGPQPAASQPPVPQPVSISLTDAVQAAHAEGFGFGEAVARDAPALWLEAVLARKPRMPSDLEARLLQGSALPIDSLLHDEVRHALRRGFWDALERSRR
jgi:NYN domain-containing protein